MQNDTSVFTEGFVACDTKAGRYRQLTELKKLMSVQGKDNFLTLANVHLQSLKTKTLLSSETTGSVKAKLCVEYRRGNQKLYRWSMSHYQDGVMPIYGKHLKTLFSGI